MLNILSFCLLSAVSSVSIYYISTSGNDHHNCGIDSSHACGTMYYATYNSYFVEHDQSATLYVDGQNATAIFNYIMSNDSNATHNFHPCFPIAMWSLTIHFNKTNINSMQDWYPSICSKLHSISAINITNSPFMFSATFHLDIYHLIIDNYQILPQYQPNGIMSLTADASILFSYLQCTDCIFKNITAVCVAPNTINSYILQPNNPYPQSQLKTKTISMKLGIISVYIFLSSSAYRTAPQLQLINNTFYNISYKQWQCNAQNVGFINSYGADFNITNTSFDMISTFHSLIHANNIADQEISSGIHNTQFLNINQGSAVYALSVYFAINIDIINTFVSTQQTYSTDTKALFYLDDHCNAEMTNIEIFYYIHLNDENCIATNMSTTGGVRYYVRSVCDNPISFIYSNARLNLYDIIISSDITKYAVSKYNKSINNNCDHDLISCLHEPLLRFNGDVIAGGKGDALISNDNEMNIYNLTVIGPTLKYTFLSNSDTLYIDGINILFDAGYNSSYDSFTLQSTEFIFQFGSSQVEIHNANIHVAVEHLFYILDEIVKVYDSELYGSTVLMEVNGKSKIYFENVIAHNVAYGLFI
eukprot:96182_1